jgi:hypothetical protein
MGTHVCHYYLPSLQSNHGSTPIKILTIFINENRLGCLVPSHYYFPQLDKHHYYSCILKFVIAIFDFSQICHTMHMKTTRAQLQAYMKTYISLYLRSPLNDMRAPLSASSSSSMCCRCRASSVARAAAVVRLGLAHGRCHACHRRGRAPSCASGHERAWPAAVAELNLARIGSRSSALHILPRMSGSRPGGPDWPHARRSPRRSAPARPHSPSRTR